MQWYRLYLKLKDTWIEECFESQMRVALCMMELKYPVDQIRYEMQKAINIFPDRSEPHYLLGRYLNQIKMWEGGYQRLKESKSKSLAQANSKYVLFVNEKVYGKYVNDELSVSCYWTGRYQEGLDLVNEIIDDPEFAGWKERLTANKSFLEAKLK